MQRKRITATSGSSAPLTDATSYVSATAAEHFAELNALLSKIEARLPDLGFIAQYRYNRDALGRIASRTGSIGSAAAWQCREL